MQPPIASPQPLPVPSRNASCGCSIPLSGKCPRSEPFGLYDAGAFPDRDQLIARNSGDTLRGTVRPADLQIGGVFGAQPEVQAEIVDGVKARLAQQRLRLALAAISGY